MENAFSTFWWVYLAVSAVIVAAVQGIKALDSAGKFSGKFPWFFVFTVALCAIGSAAMALAGLFPWGGFVLSGIVLGFLSTIGYQTFVKPWIDRGVKAG
jgi:hypothetical protein